MWFPQVLRGQVLTDLEEAAESDAGLRAMLASPQTFLNMEHEDLADQLAAHFIQDAHGWLGQWDEQLRHLEDATSETTDRTQLLWDRARPLLELKRWVKGRIAKRCPRSREVSSIGRGRIPQSAA